MSYSGLKQGRGEDDGSAGSDAGWLLRRMSSCVSVYPRVEMDRLCDSSEGWLERERCQPMRNRSGGFGGRLLNAVWG